MTTLAELVVSLVGDTSDFESKMSGAGASLEAIGSRMTSVGTSLTAGITLPLAAAGTAAIAMATQFNSGMANVASLSDDARSRVEQWGPSVQAMAVQVGQSTSNLTDGLYMVVSAFGATDDSLAILEINAIAAAAGLATTSEAISLTSAVTRAYGDTSATAVQQVADLAQQAVSMGQTTFPELAGAIGMVTPLTAALGVSQQELFAVMATGAGVTGSTSAVATQLRGVLQSLMAPTDAMAGLISDLGYESGQAMIQGMGLDGAIQAIVAAAAASGQPLQSYIGSIEGQTLALALAGPLAGSFAGNIDAMTNSAGASAAAFDVQTQGVNAAGFAMQQAAVQVQVWGQQLGAALLPALQSVMTAMQPVVDWVTRLITGFTQLSPQTQMIIIGILGFVAALGPILIVGGMVIGAIGSLVAAFSAGGIAATALGGAITLLTGPVGIVIAAVAALAAAWATNFMGIREVTAQVWAGIQAIMAPVIAWIQGTIMSVVGAVIAWWNGAWPGIQAVIQTVWSGIQTVIQTVVGIIGPTVQGMIETIRGAFANASPIVESFKALWQSLGPLFQALSPIVQGVGQVIGVVLAALGAAFMAVVGVVVGVVNGIISAMGPLVTGIMGAIDNVIGIFTGLITFVTGFWNTIVGLFTGNSQLVQQGIQQMGDGIVAIWTNLVNGVISLAEGLVGAVIGFVQGLVEGVISFFTNLYQTLVGGSIVPDMVNAIVGWFEQLSALLQAIVAAIQAFIEAAWQALLAVTQAIWEAIKAFIEGAVTTVQSIITAVVSAVQAFWQATWTAIQAFTQALWAAMQALIQAAMTAIQSLIQSVWSAVQAFWQGIWTAIQAFTQAVWAAITSLIQAALSAIQAAALAFMNLIQGAWSAFLNVIEGLWQAAWSSIAGILQSALGTLTSIANAIVSAIFGAFNQDWGSIGRNIVDSIGNALRAGLAWVADQARRIAEAALQAAMDALGIGSPSKEFMYLGEMSVAGFAGAFEDTRPVDGAVVRAIDGALSAGGRAAAGGNVDRSVRIGQVMIPGASGMSVLEQMRAYGR